MRRSFILILLVFLCCQCKEETLYGRYYLTIDDDFYVDIPNDSTFIQHYDAPHLYPNYYVNKGKLRRVEGSKYEFDGWKDLRLDTVKSYVEYGEIRDGEIKGIIKGNEDEGYLEYIFNKSMFD